MAFDNAANLSVAPSGSLFTSAFTVGSGNSRLLLVNVSYRRLSGSDAVSGVTYNGVALTQLFSTTVGNIVGEVWYLLAPSSGAHSVVVTLLPTNLEWVGIGAISLSDVNQSSPDLSTSTNGAASGDTSATANVSLTTSDTFAVTFFLNRMTGVSTTWSNPTVLTNTGYSGGSQAIPEAISSTSWVACSYGPWAGGFDSPQWNANRGSSSYGFVGVAIAVNMATNSASLGSGTFTLTGEPLTPLNLPVTASLGSGTFSLTGYPVQTGTTPVQSTIVDLATNTTSLTDIATDQTSLNDIATNTTEI